MMIRDAATAPAIALRLELPGIPALAQVDQSETGSLMPPILARQRELSRRLTHRPCTADQRIQNFLDFYLESTAEIPQLPCPTFVLDQPSLARVLSLPTDSTNSVSNYVENYRVLGSVLHSPRNDRRAMVGVLHVTKGGLPIPDGKIVVDHDIFARLLARAVDAPDDLLALPWASTHAEPARCFVSLLLHLIVIPEVPGFSAERSMEIRFIASGGLVSSLDFVEGIFGNGGGPYLPENDASLVPRLWTDHTGCVVLVPHLTKLTRKELGLPSREDATEYQHRDSQCWKNENEPYNGSKAFKRVARDERGIIIAVVANNYFGCCKKKVKTQVGCSANFFGCVEEEHAGGAIAYPRCSLGQEFTDVHTPEGLTLGHAVESSPGRFEVHGDGSAVAVEDPTVVLVPGGARYSMCSQTIVWARPNGEESSVRLLVDNTYVAPGDYRVCARHHEGDAAQWYLVGTAPWSTQAHKPTTVSGGGKSETFKSLLDIFVFGEAYVGDINEDFDIVQKILDGNYADRFVNPTNENEHHRSILSKRRSLGSVIKLLTPSSTYIDEYNAFLEPIPDHIKELVFAVKRLYRPSWGKDQRSHFFVEIINGRKGNSLRLDGEAIKINILHVDFKNDGAWRLLSLRLDFSPAVKVQTEDDITASIVTPGKLEPTPDSESSRRFMANYENLLFQRPDGAIVRGYNRQTESDMSAPDTDLFTSNSQPLAPDDARAITADTPRPSHFTELMRNLVNHATKPPKADDPAKEAYWICTTSPRLVNEVPTKDPRYLQVRPNIANPKDVVLADLSSHFFRGAPLGKPLRHNVDVIAAGRRSSPPEKDVPPLCTYNPLHYMGLPELLMEFISSVTGKSPPTTGAGSEGALIKTPFSALPAIYDLDTALLSYVLSDYGDWLSSVSYINPRVKVAHDISLLIPGIFSRMSVEERNAHNLVRRGFLEKIEDFEYEGRAVHASRLDYRMNRAFASAFFGRIFLYPGIVFTEEMLHPEPQDEAIFADSVDIIVTTHKVVAEHHRADGSIEQAMPPLRVLLEIMIGDVSREGWNLANPESRAQFEHENILSSAWYSGRLGAKAAHDIRQARETVETLARFCKGENNKEVIERLKLDERLATARAWLEEATSQVYHDHLVGSLSLQPSLA